MELVNIHRRFKVLLLLVIGIQTAQAQVWSLDQCIETAVANNQKLELEKNNIKIGKDRQDQVKANLLPKVGIETDYKYFIELPYQLMPLSAFGGPEEQFKEVQFGVSHNINANVQFVMPLYNPQVRSNIEISKIGIELAELQYQKSEEQIVFDVSNLYFNAQILLSQMQFVDENLQNSNKLFHTVKLLKDQSLAKGTDVDKIALQILQLETKGNVIQSNYDQVLNAMKVVMGLSLDKMIEVEPKIAYHQSPDFSNQPTIEIRMVEAKNHILNGEFNTLKKSQLPTVMLYGSFGLTGYGYDKSPNGFLNFYPMGFVGVKASYTLFDGNITKKKKHMKQREISNNNLQLELLKDQNKMQVANAKLKLQTSGQSVETSLSQINFAKSIYDQMVIQQKQGIASITDVLLADNTLREAQQNYLSAIIEYLKAELELKNISGNILK